jgi:hypothetical protein
LTHRDSFIRKRHDEAGAASSAGEFVRHVLIAGVGVHVNGRHVIAAFAGDFKSNLMNVHNYLNSSGI